MGRALAAGCASEGLRGRRPRDQMTEAANAAFVSVLTATLGLLTYRLGPALATSPIPTGTVMVSTGNGLVSEYNQTGTLITQLDTKTGSPSSLFETGSSFDPSSGNFFVTDFDANQVTKFDPTGALIGSFGSSYNLEPESLVFDSTGNLYVGQASGTTQILKFNSSGTLLASFSPAVENTGTDWLDLASDQCTMFYTSEPLFVHRFNVCTNTQLADLNVQALPGATIARLLAAQADFLALLLLSRLMLMPVASQCSLQGSRSWRRRFRIAVQLPVVQTHTGTMGTVPA